MGYKQRIKNSILWLAAFIYKNNNSKIIYYHDVHRSNQVYTEMSTPMELFKQHILVAKLKGYSFVKEITSPTNELMITFDDGFRGLYENFDFFIENKIPVKLFLITDFIGNKDYINIIEIKEMISSGLLTIGSHTCSHEDMTRQTIDVIEKEMYESKKILERTFGMIINDFCFPRGFYNEAIVEIGKRAGYRRLFLSIPGSFLDSDFVVKRNLVQNENQVGFANILDGALQIFTRRYFKQHIKYEKDVS